MVKENPIKLEDQAFKVSVILKGIDGIFEIIGGAIIPFIKPETINKLAIFLTQHELNRDPNDIIANYILRTATKITGNSEVFGSVYLVSHGVIKVFWWQRF